MSTKILTQLKEYAFSILIIIIVTPIFLEAFGTRIFSKTEMHEESKALYFLSSIIGQISYPLFSSLNNGYIILPCFEGMDKSRDIYENCSQHPNQIGITLCCYFLSCIVSLIGGILIHATNAGEVIARMPKTIIDTMMITVGVINAGAGCAMFVDSTDFKYSLCLILFSAALTVVAILIQKYTGKPKYLVLYIIGITAIFNSLKKVFDVQQLYDYKIFLFKGDPLLSAKAIIKLVGNFEFDIKLVAINASNIINLGIYPLISISTSLPYYLSCLGIKADFNKEILAQGLTNGVCGLGFFPSCLSCTGSILFSLCGANTKIHSILSGVFIISFFFTYQYVTPIIPSFALSILSQFIGVSLLIGFIDQIALSTWVDLILLMSFIIVYWITSFNSIFLIFFGTVLTYIIVILSSREHNKVIIKQTSNTFSCLIYGSLDFRNIQKLLPVYNVFNQDVIVDLTNCKYVDYSANIQLSQIYKELKSKEIKMQVIGRPINLNTKVLASALSLRQIN